MKPLTFEQTYPKMPFAELVRLSVLLAQAWARFRDGHGARGRDPAQAAA